MENAEAETMSNINVGNIYKMRLSFFQFILSVFSFKVPKIYERTKKFQFNEGVKNAEFYSEFISIEKIPKS
jgi:hypothetical protein